MGFNDIYIIIRGNILIMILLLLNCLSIFSFFYVKGRCNFLFSFLLNFLLCMLVKETTEGDFRITVKEMVKVILRMKEILRKEMMIRD